MKRNTNIRFLALLLVALSMAFCFASCKEKVDPTGLWKDAKYLSDTTVGEGKNTAKVEISAGEQSVVLTVKSDKDTLGEALFENGLVNDPTFFDTCNGIAADWDKHGAYWAFYVDGETAAFGIGDAKIPTESEYKIVYTK